MIPVSTKTAHPPEWTGRVTPGRVPYGSGRVVPPVTLHEADGIVDGVTIERTGFEDGALGEGVILGVAEDAQDGVAVVPVRFTGDGARVAGRSGGGEYADEVGHDQGEGAAWMKAIRIQ